MSLFKKFRDGIAKSWEGAVPEDSALYSDSRRYASKGHQKDAKRREALNKKFQKEALKYERKQAARRNRRLKRQAQQKVVAPEIPDYLKKKFPPKLDSPQVVRSRTNYVGYVNAAVQRYAHKLFSTVSSLASEVVAEAVRESKSTTRGIVAGVVYAAALPALTVAVPSAIATRVKKNFARQPALPYDFDVITTQNYRDQEVSEIIDNANYERLQQGVDHLCHYGNPVDPIRVRISVTLLKRTFDDGLQVYVARRNALGLEENQRDILLGTAMGSHGYASGLFGSVLSKSAAVQLAQEELDERVQWFTADVVKTMKYVSQKGYPGSLEHVVANVPEERLAS
ncbi:MAG: hypothetical protein Q7R56_02615 [Nanoarchaeota archaeon]|nr:hypothetical protein [Nanoarchaeota archaeon]